jgi:hypothetical protein
LEGVLVEQEPDSADGGQGVERPVEQHGVDSVCEEAEADFHQRAGAGVGDAGGESEQGATPRPGRVAVDQQAAGASSEAAAKRDRQGASSRTVGAAGWRGGQDEEGQTGSTCPPWPLVGSGDWPEDKMDAVAPLVLDGETVGFWLRSRAGTRPIAVHAGWRTDHTRRRHGVQRPDTDPCSAAEGTPNRATGPSARLINSSKEYPSICASTHALTVSLGAYRSRPLQRSDAVPVSMHRHERAVRHARSLCPWTGECASA